MLRSSRRRALLLAPVLVAAVLATVALTTSSTAQAPDPLEHFTCYRVTAPSVGKTVAVADQFGEATLSLGRPRNLCAPTEKNDEGLQNRRDHLKCYDVTEETPPFQPRDVVVVNQFTTTTSGQQQPARLRVTARDELCVPSDKNLDGPPPRTTEPPGISHYMCYKARQIEPQPFTQRRVALQDQFGTSRPLVFTPDRLCNPARKNEEPVVTQEHLVCHPIKIRAFTRNQFGTERLDDTMGRRLCLPSLKDEIG